MDADVFLYNGAISTMRDLQFIQMVAKERSRPHAVLVLVTDGGDPDQPTVSPATSKRSMSGSRFLSPDGARARAL